MVLPANLVIRASRVSKAPQDEWVCAARKVLLASQVKMAEMVPRVPSA